MRNFLGSRFTLTAPKLRFKNHLRFKTEVTGRVKVHHYMMAIPDLASENPARQWRFNFALDGPLQRPGAVAWIVARADQISASPIRQFQFDMPVSQTLPQAAHLDLHNLLQVLFGKSVEHDNLVYAVQELRTEMPALFV